MRSTSKRLLALAVAAALPMTASATNGYFSHGYGTQNKALAGAGVALPLSSMDAATNPANMVFDGGRIDAGLAVFSPRREYTVEGSPSPPPAFGLMPGTVKSDSDYFLIPSFGWNHMLDDQSSVGVTVYGNGGMNTDYPSSANGGAGTFYGGAYGGKANAGVNLEQLFVNATYARKINPRASWGISAIAAYQRFKATGLAAFGAQGYSSDSAHLTDNGTDDSLGYGAKLGITGQVLPGLRLGASYQTKMNMGEFKKYSGLFAEQGGFDIPATATLGLAFDVTPASTLVFDVQRIWYSDVASISNPMMPALQGCAGGDTTQCLGGSNGPGFGWNDMTVYKLGYQWATANDWTWRVGYSTGNQPIPSSEVMFNILAPGVMEDHFTAGFTKELGESNAVNFSAMYAPSKSVKGANPLDPGGQTIELKMHQFELEASYSWKF